MNQTQVKYARARAEATFKARTAAIKAKHTTPAITLTKAEKLEALRTGQFTIDPDQSRYSWADAVVFTAARDETIDQAALDAEQALLAAAYRKLEDELVLGDNEQALALLRAFEAADAAE
jgi:hypothetical protein